MKREKKTRVWRFVSRVSRPGQSLVEVMVAVAILVLVATGLIFGITVAINNANFAKNQARATKYAQEGMEKIRAHRDQNDWDTFKANCLAESIILGAVDSPFTREIKECREETGERVKVTVRVYWQGTSGKIHQSELTSYFTKWQ